MSLLKLERHHWWVQRRNAASPRWLRFIGHWRQAIYPKTFDPKPKRMKRYAVKAYR